MDAELASHGSLSGVVETCGHVKSIDGRDAVDRVSMLVPRLTLLKSTCWVCGKLTVKF